MGLPGQINVGDIVVVRMPAPVEHYIVGSIYDDAGQQRFRYLDNDGVKDAAIRKAYKHCQNSAKVWIYANQDNRQFEEAPRPSN